MLSKIIKNIQEGTLIQAVVRKIVSRGQGYVGPDHYRGDVARNYLTKRLKQEMWHREQEVVQEILQQYPNGIKVLDVPFGTGRFVDMLLQKEALIYGIDISQDMLSTAEEVLGDNWKKCHVELGSADDLPYENGHFDLGICFRFLGLIPLKTARKVLSELHRTCRDSVIIRVPVRKDSAEPAPPLEEDDVIQGRMINNELLVLFKEYSFVAESRQVVGERDSVEFVVFVLKRI